MAPEDLLRDLQRLQALETDVKALKTLVAANERALSDLREQLRQAQQERTLILAAAVGLLTLLLSAMVVTWWLRRAGRAGVAKEEVVEKGADAPRVPNALASPAARPAGMDLRVDESMFDSLKATRRTPQPQAVPAPFTAATHAVRAVVPLSTSHPDFHGSQVSSMQMVRAEELVDIQQQADFFMSLGQAEQAIEVLESHIRDNAETSALVWLDLLAIYRAQKRRADYESLRGDFQRVFNAQVPGYDSTPTSSGGLEDYPRALSRIAALWPSPEAMEVIEESLFRKPGLPEGEPFDLEAYRELVMLYNLGREVLQPDSDSGQEWAQVESPGSVFTETGMQRLSDSVTGPARTDEAGEQVDLEIHAPGRELHGMADDPVNVDSMLDDDRSAAVTGDEHDPRIPRPSPRLGLDIDLSAPAEIDRRPSFRSTRGSSGLDFVLSEPGEADTTRR